MPGQVSFATIDVVSTPLAGPNPKRTALLVSAGPTNRVTINFGADAVLDRGLTVPPNTQALLISAAGFG